MKQITHQMDLHILQRLAEIPDVTIRPKVLITPSFARYHNISLTLWQSLRKRCTYQSTQDCAALTNAADRGRHH